MTAHGNAAPFDSHARAAEIMAKLPPEWRGSEALKYIILKEIRRAHKAGYNKGRRFNP